MRNSKTYISYLIAGLVLFVGFFQKINKHDFYHHYFRVIAEIHVRNSQAFQVESAEKLAFLSDWQPFSQKSALFLDIPSFYNRENSTSIAQRQYVQSQLVIQSILTQRLSLDLPKKIAPICA